MVREPPLANERPTELELKNAPDHDWFPMDNPPSDPMARVQALPVHPRTSKCVHARMLSVHAVIAVVPGSGEIRIPYIRRKDKGDFALFMDALVTELGGHPVRFTNVFMSDSEGTEAYDNLERYLDELNPAMNDVDRENKARLETVLDGFTHEVEDWGRDVADTLVGTWDATRERNSDHD